MMGKKPKTPLSESPEMDRLVEILRGLPEDRKQAFWDWMDEEIAKEEGGQDNGTETGQDDE
jgi:hypothetical protein